MKRTQKRLLAFLTALAMTASLLPMGSAALLNELAAAPNKGVGDTVNKLNQLTSLNKALYIGAHPDDETNAVLVYLNRKYGADTVYATSNWGEGGDNSIGAELYNALGVLRSQELKSSRLFDGAEQMYLGLVDFGYSVSLKESLLGDPDTNSAGIWNIDIFGYNVAKVIRTSRPEVIFSNHKAPARDHGQHRANGWIMEYAMDLAANATYKIYGDDGVALAPWQAKKLYVRPYTAADVAAYPDEITAVGENSKKDPTKADLMLELGEYDPVLGMSYSEWGAIGRNMHKCQKMIGAPSKQANSTGFILKKAAPGANTNGTFSSDVFAGIGITSTADLSKVFSGKTQEINDLNNALVEAATNFDHRDQRATGKSLTAAMTALAKLETTNQQQADYVQRIKTHITAVVKDIYGLAVDIVVSDTDAVPGQTVEVTATVWARNAKASDVGIPTSSLQNGKPTVLTVPNGWKVVEKKAPADMRSRGALGVVDGRRFVYDVTIPVDYNAYTGPYNAPYNEEYTNPYFPHGGMKSGATVNTVPTALKAFAQDPAKVTEAMMKTANPVDKLNFGVTTSLTDPYSHSPILGAFTANIEKQAYEMDSEPEFRVVPKLSVLVANEASMLKYTGGKINSSIQVVLKNNNPSEAKKITVTAAPEDKASGITVNSQAVTLSTEGQTQTVTLNVTVPAAYNNKSTKLIVTATHEGKKYSEGFDVISYTHIETKNYYKKAAQNLTVAQYGLPSDDIKIGYLKTGYDDYVFDYISGMYANPAKATANLKALSVTDITQSGAALAKAYDTIIIGKTALPSQSPVSAALKAAQQNLIDYANAGGNLVLHYQNYKEDGKMPFAPAAFTLGNANINKEDSEVYIKPAAAKTPFYKGMDLKLDENGKSAASIWDGWLQQRCEWTPGTADAGQVEAMEQLGYTVLFGGQDPEGEMRPAILYKEMEKGGHYSYSAVVWERQLQALVPGAYQLYANLISMGYSK